MCTNVRKLLIKWKEACVFRFFREKTKKVKKFREKPLTLRQKIL